jgi:serine/threonine protein kinase
LTGDDPQLVGPYRLRARIGAGGMGQVYLAKTAGGRPVAVKVVRPELGDDAEFRRRFRQEVAAARRVHGMFTAEVVDADVDGPRPWLATAYVPGPSLGDVVAEHGVMPARWVRSLALGLAEALQVIHAAGVIHRDLKPSNVVLAADGPRVIDFGIARATDATTITRTGFVVGSPHFMSPEQAAGMSITPASDVFALGAVIAFAGTGRLPFGDGDSTAILYRIVHQTPNLDGLPADLRDLVAACLDKDPANRPSPADILAWPFGTDPAPAKQTPPGLPTPDTITVPRLPATKQSRPSTRWGIRSRRLWLTAGGVLVVVSALLMVLVINPWDKPPLSSEALAGDPGEQVDPCSLVDPAAFEKYGTAQMPGKPSLDDCTVYVPVEGDGYIDVIVGAQISPDFPRADTRDIADLGRGATIVQAADRDSCDAFLVLTDIAITVRTSTHDTISRDTTCGLTESAAREVFNVLDSGQVEHWTPKSNSLATVTACDLLPVVWANEQLLSTADPVPAMTGHGCDWGERQAQLRYAVAASPGELGIDKATRAEVIAGRESWVSNISGDCLVATRHIEFALDGDTFEFVMMRVSIPDDVVDPCALARTLVGRAWPRLPSPS